MPTAFHPGANFPGFAPVPLAAPALGPRQFFPPPIFYWPYPSPPVSPTSYYAPTMPPPGALPPQQPQQAMVSRIDGIFYTIVSSHQQYFI